MPTLPTRLRSSPMLTAIPTHSQLVQTSAQERRMLVTSLLSPAQLIATTVTTLSTQLQLNSARPAPSTTIATATHRTSMQMLPTRLHSSPMLTAIHTHSQLVQTSAQERRTLVTALRSPAQSIAMTLVPASMQRSASMSTATATPSDQRPLPRFAKLQRHLATQPTTRTATMLIQLSTRHRRTTSTATATPSVHRRVQHSARRQHRLDTRSTTPTTAQQLQIQPRLTAIPTASATSVTSQAALHKIAMRISSQTPAMLHRASAPTSTSTESQTNARVIATAIRSQTHTRLHRA